MTENGCYVIYAHARGRLLSAMAPGTQRHAVYE